MARDTDKRRQPQRSRDTAAAPATRQTAAESERARNTRAGSGSMANAREGASTRRASRVMAERRRRQQRMLWLVGGISAAIVVVIIAVAAIISSNQSSACVQGTLSCGTQAPDFTLPQEPGGKLVTLSSYKGHPVLLEMFATWCPHCQREAPILDSIYAANQKKGLAMLSVVSSPYDHNYESTGKQTPVTPADLVWFKTNLHVTTPVLWDPNVASATNSQAAIYQVTGFPTIYLIDKKGVIRWSHSGEITQADLQTAVNTVL